MILVRSLINPSAAARSRSSRPSSVTSNQRSVAPVRCASSCHGTMLEWCSITEMTISSPGRRRGADRVRAEVQRLGRVLGEDDLLGAIRADELGELGPRTFERLGRLGAEQVHRPGHVRVVVEVMIFDRLDDDPRLLRGVGAVQVDQRPLPGGPFQDREVGPDVLDVERDRLVGAVQFVDPVGERHLVDIRGGRVLRPSSRLTWATPLLLQRRRGRSGRSPRPRAARPAPDRPARPPGRRRRRARSRA